MALSMMIRMEKGKKLVYSLSSLFYIADLCRRLTANKVKILMYHGVVHDEDDIDCWWMLKEKLFKKQIDYIAKHFQVVSLDEALEVILTQKKKRNLLVLTFDDGYRNFCDVALPILKSFNMPCTLYVTTGLSQENSKIWTDRLFLAIHHSRKACLDLSDLSIGTWQLKDRYTKRLASHKIIDILKTFPVEKKNNLLEGIIKRINKDGYSNYYVNNSFDLLTVNEIKNISEEKTVTLGSHAVSHEILTKLPLNIAAEEISESKDTLEKWIGKLVHHFAYPNGSYNNEIVEVVNRIGFKSAVLAGFLNAENNNPFTLNRIGIGAWDNMDFFKCNVCGLLSLKQKIKRFANQILQMVCR